MIEIIYILIAMLPGVIASFLIFENISLIERIVLSFGLSISFLLIILLNLNAFYHIPINLENVLMISLILILLLVIYKRAYLHGRIK